jgi:hypothetical protein
VLTEDHVFKGHYHIILNVDMVGSGAIREVEACGISLKRLPMWLAPLEGWFQLPSRYLVGPHTAAQVAGPPGNHPVNGVFIIDDKSLLM